MLDSCLRKEHGANRSPVTSVTPQPGTLKDWETHPPTLASASPLFFTRLFKRTDSEPGPSCKNTALLSSPLHVYFGWILALCNRMYRMWRSPFSSVKCCFHLFFFLSQKTYSRSVQTFRFDFLCPCLDVPSIKARILLTLFSLPGHTWRCHPAHIMAELSMPGSKVHWRDQTSLSLFINSNSNYQFQVSVNIKPTLFIYQVKSNLSLDEMCIFNGGTLRVFF